MRIKWLGHACFKVTGDKGSIIFDPFADGSVPGYQNIREHASEVYCSHEHSDHNARNVIDIVSGVHYPSCYIDTYHDDKQGSLRGKNRIYIVEVDGYKVVHLGDLGCDLTNQQIDQLHNADVCMVPVGGTFTIDAQKAKKIMEQIQPRYIIPMHYHQGHLGYDVLAEVEEFTKLFDSVEYLNSNEIEYSELKKKVNVFKY